MPAALFPLLVVTHVTLAIGLFLPSILLPFALRTRRAATESPSPVGTRWPGSSGPSGS